MELITQDQVTEFGKLRSVTHIVAHPIGQEAIKDGRVREHMRNVAKLRGEPIPLELQEKVVSGTVIS